MEFDDSNRLDYQKFKVDKFPKTLKFEKVDYILLPAYYKHKYNKVINPIQRRNGRANPKKSSVLNVVHHIDLFMITMVVEDSLNLKFCGLTFKETNYATKPFVFICPYCGATLMEQKQRKHYKIHRCNNSRCSYYQKNLTIQPIR